MLATANLRRQHRQLMASAAALRQQLRPDEIVRRAGDARGHLLAIAGVMSVHLVMEEGVVYPRVRAAGTVPELVERHARETADFKASFRGFTHRWRSVELIVQQPRAFVRDATAVLDAMVDRTMREERELYPLADAADAPPDTARSTARETEKNGFSSGFQRRPS